MLINFLIFGFFTNVVKILQTTLLQKTLQTIISEDQSVLEMISCLSNLQNGLSPLADLVASLKMDLRGYLSGVEVGSNAMVVELKFRLDQMISSYQRMEQSAGKDIFLSFLGLFLELDQKVVDLRNIFDTMIIPMSWNQIIDVQEYYSLPKDEVAIKILGQLFLVQRLEAMIEFFSLCLQMAWAFNGSGIMVTCDIENLSKPFRKYLQDFIIQHLAGIGSFSLILGISSLLERNNIHPPEDREVRLQDLWNQIPMPSMPVSAPFYMNFFKTLEQKFRKDEGIQNLSCKIKEEGENIKMFDALLISHHWLNEVGNSFIKLKLKLNS